MDLLRRLVFSLIALAVVGAAAYYILKQDRVFEIVIPSGPLGDKARAVINPIRENVVKAIDGATAGIRGKAQEIIDDITGVVKQKAFDSVKDAVNEKLNEVGKDLGVPKTEGTPPGAAMVIGGGATAAPKMNNGNVPLGFSVKKGQPAIFVLKDVSEAGGKVSYAITWGDGKTESGTLGANDAKTISHRWDAVGEYIIEITMTVGETTRVYRVYIIVYA